MLNHMEAPPNDPEVGDTLGGYRVEALLGEGGMGKVFRACREADGEVVALKVLRPSLAGDRHYVKRFRREAHAAASVRHPHVVPLIDVAPEGEQPYIVQRFISGGTLEGRLKRGGQMPLPDVVKTCLQVAAGIDA